MRITISGNPGSGKSTIAKMLAKELGYKHYSMGDLQREIAKKRGISLKELQDLEEKDSSIDDDVDKRQIELDKKEDNFVIDSRLGYHFIPNSVKIFLDCDVKEAAKRIHGAKREGESFKNIEDTEKSIKKRIESERKRYKKYYNTDPYDPTHYHFVIDTTNITPKQVLSKIIEMVG